MKIKRTSAARAALLVATSFSALAIATPAAADASKQEYDRTSATEALNDMVLSAAGHNPIATEQIVANHTVTPGPGNPATGANYANSPQVLDPLGSINGIGQQIAFTQTSPTGGSLGLCTGSLINPRTVITAAHCVSSKPAHRYGSQTGTGAGVNGPFGAGGAVVTSVGAPISFGFASTNRCLGVAANGCAVGEGTMASAG